MCSLHLCFPCSEFEGIMMGERLKQRLAGNSHENVHLNFAKILIALVNPMPDTIGQPGCRTIEDEMRTFLRCTSLTPHCVS